MTISLLSGVLLVVVLAIVFIPIALEYEGQAFIRIELAVDPDDRYRVVVARINRPFAFEEFRVDVYDGSDPTNLTLLSSLDLASAVEDVWIRFDDVDASGTLSEGDAFRLANPPGAVYDVRLFFKPRDIHVARVLVP
jgi:hypothetical protein